MVAIKLRRVVSWWPLVLLWTKMQCQQIELPIPCQKVLWVIVYFTWHFPFLLC